jgi:hypothetical protein
MCPRQVPALARLVDENAGTRCCAGVDRTLGIVPYGVKIFITPIYWNLFHINHSFAQKLANSVQGKKRS